MFVSIKVVKSYSCLREHQLRKDPLYIVPVINIISTSNARPHILNLCHQHPQWLIVMKGTFGPMMINNSVNVNTM